MKPEEIRIAIAEACGWTDVKSSWQGQQCFGYENKTDGHVTRVPDFTNDLNACFEMEEMLTPEQKKAYRKTLADICRRDGNIFATAGQRCEAFLRTVGLWRE